MDDDITERRGSRPGTRNLVVGAAGVVLVLLAGLLISRVAAGAPIGLDAAWAATMSTHRAPAVVNVAMALAVVGGTTVVFVVTAVLGLTLLVLRRRRTAIVLVASVLLASGASSLIKILVGRPRPPGGLVRLSSLSFPSGHTTTAAVLAAVLLLAVPRLWTWVIAIVWVAAIAWSRTSLGVHWLSDVVAGAVLGASVALLVHGAATMIWRRPGAPSAGASGRRRTASAAARPAA